MIFNFKMVIKKQRLSRWENGKYDIWKSYFTFRRNEIPLEDSIALFQEGIELSKYCDDKLKNIQEKVAQIYENGQLKDMKTEE